MTARKSLLGILAFVLALPVVAAARGYTGISPLNRVVELLATMFNIPILQNPTVQILFLRFALFVLFLALVHYGLKKFMPNKTAGVIATVFALISSLLAPESIILANGGIIAAVLSGLIPLGIVGYGLYFCVTKLNENFATRLIAIVILLMLLGVVDMYYDITGLGTPSYGSGGSRATDTSSPSGDSSPPTNPESDDVGWWFLSAIPVIPWRRPWR